MGAYDGENVCRGQTLEARFVAFFFQFDTPICGETHRDIYLAPLQHGYLGRLFGDLKVN